jgi:hypothetical protein
MASAAFAADAYRSYAYDSGAAAFAPHFDDRAAMQRYRAMLANDVARAQVRFSVIWDLGFGIWDLGFGIGMNRVAKSPCLSRVLIVGLM